MSTIHSYPSIEVTPHAVSTWHMYGVCDGIEDVIYALSKAVFITLITQLVNEYV